MNESLTDSVIHEVKGETGSESEVTGIVSTCTAHTGVVRRQFNICYATGITGTSMYALFTRTCCVS